MVIQIAFLILQKIFPLENALTEIMTLRKFVYSAQPKERPLISIHCNNKNRQILCNLNIWMFFFCVCKPLQKNKFYFYSTSKNILIPVQSNHPDIIQTREDVFANLMGGNGCSH